MSYKALNSLLLSVWILRRFHTVWRYEPFLILECREFQNSSRYQEKNQEIVKDLEQGLYRKRMLSYGGLLKQKHKILNLDDAEKGNLINTSDEEKTTDEEEKANSITAIWNFEKQNYYLKNVKR